MTKVKAELANENPIRRLAKTFTISKPLFELLTMAVRQALHVALYHIFLQISLQTTNIQHIIQNMLNNLRLYRTLLELAREFGRSPDGRKSVVIDMPLTHQRLADMIGSNRVTVTRKLLELQKRGVIAARGNGSIEILDLDALNRLTVHDD